MIKFERLTIDTDFEVWDILHNDIKVGYLRKSNKYFLEVLYVPYTLRLNQRQFIMPIVSLICGFSDLKAITEHYVPYDNLSSLGKGFTRYEDYTIKN